MASLLSYGGRVPISGRKQPQGRSRSDCLRARMHLEPGEHRRNMMLYCLGGGGEAAGNLGIGKALSQQHQHFHFSAGQPGLIRPGRRARSTRNPLPALRTHALPHPYCGGLRVQLLEERQGTPLGVSVALRQRQRLLVGAARLCPPRGGALPIARQLPRIRLKLMARSQSVSSLKMHSAPRRL